MSSSPSQTPSSSIRPSTPTIFTPPFHPAPSAPENSCIAATISALGLLPHIEGGYFVQTDRDPLLIPNPFLSRSSTFNATTTTTSGDKGGNFRNASTTIFYFLTPKTPWGSFHMNRARTVHTLHWGRGRYVTLKPGENGEAEVETWVVGRNVGKGEKLQWIVEGGVWKGSWLLDDGEEGLLISETVVPGFEYVDHEFMTRVKLDEVLGEEKAEELAWLIRRGPPPQESEFVVI